MLGLKHIEIDFHFVCDMVAKKTLNVRNLSLAKTNLLICLTKPHFFFSFCSTSDQAQHSSHSVGLEGAC
jgi:hypothetical protein